MPEQAAAPTKRGRGNPNGLRYDEPANLTIPDAPANVPLWEYLIEIAQEDDNWDRAADIAGRGWKSIATACCRPARAGSWPLDMLPGGKNWYAVEQEKEARRASRNIELERQTNEAKTKIYLADEAHHNAIAAKRPQPPMDCTPPSANPNDRTAQHPYMMPRQKVYRYMEDPVIWCEEKHPLIENKKYGQVPMRPWMFQKEIMRAVMQGGVHLYLKSRQVAVTTPIQVAWGHALLYQYVVTGKPFHGHIFANKEDKALGIVKKARLAITSAELTPEERKGLKGSDHTTNVKKTFYRQPGADNHIFVHTTTGVDIRGDDVNCVLIDEGDFIMNLEEVWASCIEAVEIGDYISVVSSINPHEPVTGFRNMFFEEAPQRSWNTMKIDWRGNEERLVNRAGEKDEGAEWEREQREQMGDSLFEVAHNLKIKQAGSALVKVATLRRYAAKQDFWGNERMAGHRYVKGLDIGGQGDNDPCVFVVIDMTVRPGQVVYERNFNDIRCHPGEEPTAALQREIEAEDARWDGPTFVDITQNRSFVALLKLKDKCSVKMSAGIDADNRKYDRGSGLRIRTKARAAIVEEFLTALETGELVVFEKETPELWLALETAKYASLKKIGPDKGTKQDASKAKRQGKNPDYFDAAMLARLGMGRVRGGRRTQYTEDGEPVDDAVDVEEQRRGGRELHQSGPADRLADVKGSLRWQHGDKY